MNEPARIIHGFVIGNEPGPTALPASPPRKERTARKDPHSVLHDSTNRVTWPASAMLATDCRYSCRHCLDKPALRQSCDASPAETSGEHPWIAQFE